MADFSDLLESYYEEIDPDKRKKTLDEYLAAAGDSDPAAAYRKALYEYRFVDPATASLIPRIPGGNWTASCSRSWIFSICTEAAVSFPAGM